MIWQLRDTNHFCSSIPYPEHSILSQISNQILIHIKIYYQMTAINYRVEANVYFWFIITSSWITDRSRAGVHKAVIKVLAGLSSLLEARLGENPFICSFRLFGRLHLVVIVWLRAWAWAWLLTIGWWLASGVRGCLLLPLPRDSILRSQHGCSLFQGWQEKLSVD